MVVTTETILLSMMLMVAVRWGSRLFIINSSLGQTAARAAPGGSGGLPGRPPAQVHTTGMDIQQPATALAALTLSKDNTLRDYAQGAYRMRQIGLGQCIEAGRWLPRSPPPIFYTGWTWGGVGGSENLPALHPRIFHR